MNDTNNETSVMKETPKALAKNESLQKSATKSVEEHWMEIRNKLIFEPKKAVVQMIPPISTINVTSNIMVNPDGLLESEGTSTTSTLSPEKLTDAETTLSLNTTHNPSPKIDVTTMGVTEVSTSTAPTATATTSEKFNFTHMSETNSTKENATSETTTSIVPLSSETSKAVDVHDNTVETTNSSSSIANVENCFEVNTFEDFKVSIKSYLFED